MRTAKTSNVEVSIRVRPMRSELGERSTSWDIDGSRLTERGNALLEAGAGTNTYTFDHVYDPRVSNREVYETSVRDNIVAHVASGYNGTVFAYGQTGSGKSFTMLGETMATGGGVSATSGRQPGIVELALRDLFSLLQKQERPKGYAIRVFLEMIEIYNEQLRDLLVKPGESGLPLSIREGEHGVFVHNAVRRQVVSPEDCMRAMQHEAAARVVAATAMNDNSSRSHCLIRITVEKTMTFSAAGGAGSDLDASNGNAGTTGGALEQKIVSSLNLVDLAGSERVAKTGATGQRMVEGGHINKSLTTLTTVIMKMSEARKPGQPWHVPYRDSKLTLLLKTAIGGNSFTTVFCCVTAAEQHVDESRSTLQFAQRAKRIRNEVQVNEVADPRTKIRALELEVTRLRRQGVATDLYLWSKRLKIQALERELAGGGAGSGGSKGEEVARLITENAVLRQELQDAVVALDTLGKDAGAGAAGGNAGRASTTHIDPMTGMALADTPEMAELRRRMHELEETLRDEREARAQFESQAAELEEMLDELESEGQQRTAAADAAQQANAQLRERTRVLDAEKSALDAEVRGLKVSLQQIQEQRRAEEQRLLDAARGDDLLEELTEMHVKHNALQLEHNTLFEMYSKAEIERVATEQELTEARADAEAKHQSAVKEVQQLQQATWRFLSLAQQLAPAGSAHAETLSSSGGAVRPNQVECGVRLLTEALERLDAAGGPTAASDPNSLAARGFRRAGGSAAVPSGSASPLASPGSSGPVDATSVAALQKRVKELEAVIAQKDAQRDVIVDTKLKRMQELVLRLHTSHNTMSLEVARVVAENNRLHELIGKNAALSAMARNDGLKPANLDLVATQAAFAPVPAPPYFHN